jgi:hypothetical protein
VNPPNKYPTEEARRAAKRATHARWRAKPENKRKLKNAELKREYGITIETFEAMVEWQGAVCVICGSDKNLNVDHNHTTGRVRAILCSNCNLGIGNFQDNPVFLRAAAIYLEGHEMEMFEFE